MKHRLISALAVLLVAVCVPVSALAGEYVVVTQGERWAERTGRAIDAAGGTIQRIVPEIGVALVSADAGFEARVAGAPGVLGVSPNVVVDWLGGVVFGPAHDGGNGALMLDADSGSPPFSDRQDFLFNLQWGHTAVRAVPTWDELGFRGAGVRVAVLDTGFDLTHPDLTPNINFELSQNFVDGEELQYGLPDPFSHGTHVAGTVAAADNGFGVIGIAPDAELVLVKVLGDAGSGTFFDVMDGVVYAANVGADVINASLGANVPRHGIYDPETGELLAGADAVNALLVALDRATTYAYQAGTTVIAAAGNEALDLDKSASVVSVPAQLAHVISVAATGPIGWGADPEVNLDLSPSYTNFGRSGIDLSGPGGNFDGFFLGLTGPCEVAGLTRPCWVFDMVMSTGSLGQWFWGAGTSMASPHVAGVAALIIGANGAQMHPAAVFEALRRGADQPGAPGRDPFFGHGRVNAESSVQ
jgi:lantibiotic leader peptide-processing serine protease